MSDRRMTWIYQARRVATRATNDGITIIDITIPESQVAKLISCKVLLSGTNDINVYKRDEDFGEEVELAVVASGAARRVSLPSIGSSSASHANIVNSTGMLFGAGSVLNIYVTGNGANGDTVTVGLELELYNVPTQPTWSIARSTGTAPTLAANTIAVPIKPGRSGA